MPRTTLGAHADPLMAQEYDVLIERDEDGRNTVVPVHGSETIGPGLRLERADLLG